MRTVEQHASTGASWLKRCVSNIKLLQRIGKMIFSYGTEGRRIRRLYHAKQARGEVFWVDEEITT